MKELKSKHIEFNNQSAKVCIPVMGNTMEEIITQAKSIKKMDPDIIEWRADYFLQANRGRVDIVSVLRHILAMLCDIFADKPIIFTIRTKAEGGEADISDDEYGKLCIEAAKLAEQNNVDFIDVEIYRLENAKQLIEKIHTFGVSVIGSNHDFYKTPSKEEMINILCEMEKSGVDICKLAVMPQEKEDVTTFIEASKSADEILKIPLITMSMSELGAITRVCTKLTGSVLTFASGVNKSAPGQPDIETVRALLQFHAGCSVNGNIALIGFMGTGKTTVSKALSRITGFEEVDVDAYIVEKEKMTISEIFAQKGESGFRDIETNALHEIAKKSGQIISCGGGAVLRDENVQILKQTGTIVLLTATPETVFDRVKDHTHRPLLNDDMSLKHVRELMEKREPRYNEVADIVVRVDSNDRVETCYSILKALKRIAQLQ